MSQIIGIIASMRRFFYFFLVFGVSAPLSAAELGIDITQVGNGATAQNGMRVSVHYEGRLNDGTVFDASRPRGQAFRFVLGAGQVIQGWEQGILGMKEGERRILTIPPQLGYGSRGAGAKIPPNATLRFEVELLKTAWPPKLQQASNQDLQRAQKNGTLIIDIRRPEEWAQTGIIEGAELITAFTKSGQLHPEFQQKFMSVITDRDTPVMLYCRTGNRTTNLGRALVDQLGFADVSHRSGVASTQTEVFTEDVALAVVKNAVHGRLHVGQFLQQAGVIMGIRSVALCR